MGGSQSIETQKNLTWPFVHCSKKTKFKKMGVSFSEFLLNISKWGGIYAPQREGKLAIRDCLLCLGFAAFSSVFISHSSCNLDFTVSSFIHSFIHSVQIVVFCLWWANLCQARRTYRWQDSLTLSGTAWLQGTAGVSDNRLHSAIASDWINGSFWLLWDAQVL